MRNARARGRPPQTERAHRINLTLTLYESEHADLLTWFRQIPQGIRPQAVITALRQGGMNTRDNVATVAEGDEWIADADFEAMLDML